MNGPERKRGRPRVLDRQAGLDVAARLFLAHGYEGTSIADLTRGMGVSPPSLYATFGSKEALFGQALDFAIARATRTRTEALGAAMPAYEALEIYLRDAARMMSDPDGPRGCILSTAVLQHAEENAAVARMVAARREASVQTLKLRFDRAVAEGDLPAGADTDTLARFYSAVVQGMSAQACDGACAERLGRIVELSLSAWPARKSPRPPGPDGAGRPPLTPQVTPPATA